MVWDGSYCAKLCTSFWYDETGLTRETGAYEATYLRDPDGLLLSKFGSSISNYGRNRLGSITMMTDTSQAVVRTHKYDPWGETLASRTAISLHLSLIQLVT